MVIDTQIVEKQEQEVITRETMLDALKHCVKGTCKGCRFDGRCAENEHYVDNLLIKFFEGEDADKDTKKRVIMNALPEKKEDENDPVSHPSHYTYGKIECIDYIADKQFDFCLGNAVKYITRARHKLDAVEDLKKAAWYINKEIELISK